MATSIATTSPIASGSLGELEIIIKMALKKTGSMKEFYLCPYLSDDGRPFLPSTYLRLRDTERETLLNLIREKILDRDPPYKIPAAVQEKSVISPYAGQSLEGCIREAMTKLNILRETALCKYIPCEVGYLHHFTFLKMKSSNPIQLRNLIKEHILDRVPKLVPPKKRNRRLRREILEETGFSRSFETGNLGNVTKPDYSKISEQKQRNSGVFESELLFSERKNIVDFQNSENSKIDQLLNMMGQLVQTLQREEHRGNAPIRREREVYERVSHEKEISRRYLQIIKNQLIKKIRMKEVDYELWNAFIELL